MFTLNGVTLRPLEFDDIETLYNWSASLRGGDRDGHVWPIDNALNDGLLNLKTILTCLALW